MMSRGGGSKQLTQSIWRYLGFSDGYHISLFSVRRGSEGNHSVALTTAVSDWHEPTPAPANIFSSLSVHSLIHDEPRITSTSSSRKIVYSSRRSRRVPDGDVIRTISSSKQIYRSGRGENISVESGDGAQVLRQTRPNNARGSL